jgi:hypothetical protein
MLLLQMSDRAGMNALMKSRAIPRRKVFLLSGLTETRAFAQEFRRIAPPLAASKKSYTMDHLF